MMTCFEKNVTYTEFYYTVGPKVKVRARQEIVRRGDRITLRCEAEGDQPLDVSWRTRGSKIEPDYDIRYDEN